MELFKKTISYSVVALQVLIVILLVFENQLSIPLWLQSVGRVHPLMLHLPIGLLLITTLIAFGQRWFTESYKELFSFLLYLSAFTASVSALMGMVLSLEGGYNEGDLLFHKWFGIALSFMCWFLISVSLSPKIQRPALLAATLVLVVTGHFGANLTHGEDFIFGPLAQEVKSERVLTDSSTVFTAAIEPILEAKCYSCHNEQKAKGKLILTSQAAIAKGGKNGVLWKGDESLLMDRLNLPIDHKKHMPPKDKAQLTDDELDFIQTWILRGGNFETKVNSLPATDTLRLLASKIIDQYHNQPHVKSIYSFASAPADKIEELNTPYRTVFRIAANEPALQVDFFLREAFDSKFIDELKSVKDQVVAINLSKMPISDADLNKFKSFTNLEKLILNQTDVEGKTLAVLNALPNLKMLSLSGTKVKAGELSAFEKNRSLREVYLWNTGVGKQEETTLQQRMAHIRWDTGYHPDEKEKMRLSPPILRNDGQVLKRGERVSYKHNLPGAVIRYVVNGEMPDSVSGDIYKDEINIDRYAIVKSKAFKDGWLSSNVSEHIFFPEGVKPDRATLLTKPEDRYMGEGASTLIDNRKGMPDFYRDPVWMGFRNQNLEALFYFDKNIPEISNVTLSYARNIYAMCMPPSEIQVWGGDDEKNLKLLASYKPEQPKQYVPTRIEGADIAIPPSKFKCYKLVAKTLTKLPEFRKAPKEKGWLMVDEVFFN
ncbi:MAG TPA: c-type cytochrome domain-containing protein [Chryseosolibacter sp.]